GRLFRPIIGEKLNSKKTDGMTSKYLNSLANWTSKSVDKLTETRRLIFSPEGRGAFASTDALDEIMAKIVPTKRVAYEVSDEPDFDSLFQGSKLTSAAGEPIEVYHGTSADFTDFNPVNKDGGVGVYFAQTRKHANVYARERARLNGG